MIKSINDKVTLNDGVEMQWFGLGVYRVAEGEEVYNSVRWALEAGYRLVDTAAFYENEEGVGRAIRDSGIPREEIFVTTKVWNTDHGYERTLRACEKSLTKLGMDYADLYLIHWPGQNRDRMLKTWEALLELKALKKIRSAGVSNFKQHHIDTLIGAYDVTPSVNQIELHPWDTKEALLQYAKRKGIIITAWGPIFHGHLSEVPEVHELGRKYGKSGAQVVLRWHLQKGVSIIPKSVHKERIVENAQLFDFEISPADMKYIDNLNRDRGFGPDPDMMNAGFSESTR